MVICSCTDLLDVPLDKSIIAEDKIFNNDVTATAAVSAMYNTLVEFSALSAKPNGVSALTSLSANELTNALEVGSFIEFETHQISQENTEIQSTWTSIYNIIYQSNAIIEGLSKSTELSQTKSKQLEGEARFVRAFCYFYLINLFGEIPLITSTDYNINKIASRTSTDKIYDLIINDLTLSHENLNINYPSTFRARPNKMAAAALLARVHLYVNNYEKSEQYATAVINDPTYFLTDIQSVFLKESPETIWQLASTNEAYATLEGFYFILTSTPSDNILSPSFISTIPQNDARRSAWIGEYYDADLDTTYYFPYKYKVKVNEIPNPPAEYSIVLRLSEIYLIRAEARVKQNKNIDALSDLNIIHSRAETGEINETDTQVIIDAIAKERRIELFTEWAHIWFDLKRTNRAVEDIGNGLVKSGLLYPIPKSEFNKNKNLGKQNDGY